MRSRRASHGSARPLNCGVRRHREVSARMGILGRIISLLSSGPPIQNLDRIDMKIDFKDGGVLLPIVVSQHLDASPEVAALIKAKLETYLGYLNSGELKDAKYVNVEFKCVKRPDPAAVDTIESFRESFKAKGADLSWKS
jgi:hypothetical protein